MQKLLPPPPTIPQTRRDEQSDDKADAERSANERKRLPVSVVADAWFVSTPATATTASGATITHVSNGACSVKWSEMERHGMGWHAAEN
jgi:hypothetical protein